MPEFVQVLTTVGNQDEARRIADALIERRLAACVHIVGPVESFYRWQGKIEDANEAVMIVKTRMSLAEKVTAGVKSGHSYETPAVLVLPILGGSQPYIDWILAETEKAER